MCATASGFAHPDALRGLHPTHKQRGLSPAAFTESGASPLCQAGVVSLYLLAGGVDVRDAAG
jgi:hypothetical protein